MQNAVSVIFRICLLVVLIGSLQACDSVTDDNRPQPKSTQVVVKNDSYTTYINTPVVLSILDNDSVPAGSIVQISTSSHGGVISNEQVLDGSYVYTPKLNFFGTDTLTYNVCSGAICNTGLVMVNVLDTNIRDTVTQPVCKVSAQNDDESTLEDRPITISVLKNDKLCGKALLTIVSNPKDGNAIIAKSGLDIIYTPRTKFMGIDYFTYQVCDIYGHCATATARISVLKDLTPAYCDSVFAATPDTFYAEMNKQLSIDVKALYINDLSCPNYINPVSFNFDARLLTGSLIRSKQSTLTYTPNLSFTGIDRFRYSICNSSGSICKSAEVVIKVR